MRLTNITRVVTALAIIVAFGIGGPALADSFFKQVVHSDAYEMMGQKQPEKNDTTALWLTKGKASAQTGNEYGVIFDAEKNVIYMLDHKKKEYSIVSLSPADESGGGESDADDQAKMMMRAQAMMGAPKITVTPTKETKTIGDWKTTMYTVELSMAMMATKQKMWVTKDIKIDNGAYHAVCGGMMAQMPGFGDLVETMKQIEGVPVLSTTSAAVMGKEIITTTELIDYAEKDAPDGIYDIPKGYKKVELKMGMGGH